MKNYRNRIITITGDPGSGKGTVTKALKQLYEAEGIKVKVISAGEVFRKIAVREYKKKFPDIATPSLEEILSDPKFRAELKKIDGVLDREIQRLVDEFNSEHREGEVLIVESRLGFYYNRSALLHVKLTADPETAGKRIFNDPKRGPEDQYKSEQEAIEDTAKRKELEIQRYREYGADLTDLNNFDLVIETTQANINDIARTIKICAKLKLLGAPFAKTWASPELFYPTQKISFTWSTGPWTSGKTPEELSKSIKKYGIYPDAPVYSTTIENSPYQFVGDGHHRVFGSIIAGITLIPYKATRHTNKATVSSQRALSSIYDHEDCTIRPDGTAFRYAKYPEIDEKAQGHDMVL